MRLSELVSVFPEDVRLLLLEPDDEITSALNVDVWEYDCLQVEKPALCEREIELAEVGKGRFGGVLVVRLKR